MKIEISSLPSGFIRNSLKENIMVGLTLRGFYLETKKAFLAYINRGRAYCHREGLEMILDFLREENKTIKQKEER
jgi:hypothetical protein